MDTLEKLEEKITRAVSLIEKLTGENKNLKEENSELRTKMSQAESKLAEIEKDDMEKTEKMKSKLGNILDKLNTLEQF